MHKDEDKFNRFLVQEYLKYGSVDEVYKHNSFYLPVSYANYQRILDKWGIVKAAGAHTKLNEVIDFLYELTKKEIPFDTLYKKMPLSFRTSAVTLYRILSYVKEGLTRRVGTGLIITPFDNQRKILIGKDVSTPRNELGKPYGALTIPMGFSRKRDSREDAVMRILQQEVFTDFFINNKDPQIIPPHPKPFMYLDIADVRVEIIEIRLPKKLSGLKNFSSYKLSDFKFIDIDNSKTPMNFRIGVTEAIEGYKKFLEFKKRNFSFNPLQQKSRLNYQLIEYPDGSER